MSGTTPNPPRHGEGDRAQRGGGGSRFTQRPETYTARKLRRDVTPPEAMLWKRLRGQQTGLKFRRQHPIGPYVVDFYCASGRLVVEVDGLAHDNAERMQRDNARDEFLIETGHCVLRLLAAEVLRDVETAVAAIVAGAANPLHRACGTVPLPASGEDLR